MKRYIRPAKQGKAWGGGQGLEGRFGMTWVCGGGSSGVVGGAQRRPQRERGDQNFIKNFESTAPGPQKRTTPRALVIPIEPPAPVRLPMPFPAPPPANPFPTKSH